MMRRRQWKQGTALILTAAMVLGSSSFTVLAEEAQSEITEQEEIYAVEQVSEESSDMVGTEETTSENVTEELDTTEQETSEAEETTEAETEPASDTVDTEPETSEMTEETTLQEEAAMKMMPMAAVLQAEPIQIGMDSEWGNENGWTWMYVGQEQEFWLDEAELPEFSDCTVEWSCIRNDDSGQTSDVVKITATGMRAVVQGPAESDDGTYVLVAEVKQDENVVARAEKPFNVREPYYEYQFPYNGGISQLPGWWVQLEKNFNCYVEDAEHPHGGDAEVEITDVRVENGDGDAVSTPEQWEDGNGWDLRCENYGHAVVTVFYTCLDGTPDQYQFDIWVGGDVYHAELFSSTNTNQMRPGTSLDLTASVRLECYDDENGHYEGDASDTKIEWSIAEGEDVVSIREDAADNKRLHVTAKEDASGRNARIEARVMRNGEEVACADMWLYVSDSYYKLNLGGAEKVQNLNPGQETTLTPELLMIDEEYPDGIPAEEEIQYRLEWDENQLEITDADQKKLNHEEGGDYGKAPFNVKRLTSDGFGFTVIAEIADENNNFEECARQFVDVDGKNYDIYFKDLLGGDHSWVFTDGDATISLNMESLAGMETRIEWFIGRWNEETDQLDEFPDASQYYTDNNDGSITLHGAKLENICKPEDESRDFSVEAKVYAGDYEIANPSTGLHTRAPRYDYHFPLDDPGEDTLLMGWSTRIDSTMRCYVENSEYPNGAELDAKITGLEISEEYAWIDGEEQLASGIVQLTETGDGWEIQACDNQNGYAVLKMTYDSLENGSNNDFTFTVWVPSDKATLIPKYPNEDKNPNHSLAPGEEMIIGTELLHEWDYGENGAGSEYEKDYKVEIQLEENGSPMYNTDLFNVEIVNDKEVKITAKEGAEYGYTDIWVRAFVRNTDGIYEEVCNQRLYVEICKHEFEWITDKEPGVGVEGQKHEECVHCQYKNDPVKIPALPNPSDPSTPDEPTEPEGELKKAEDGKFYYYVGGRVDKEFKGIVKYDGGEFYVKDGTVATDTNGLNLVDDTFYFLAQGQVQRGYTGLAQYDGEWFYLTDGVLDITIVGIVSYDGGLFVVASGRIAREANGLWQDPRDGKWYFAALGQIQTQHTGVAAYDGQLFYVINGKLATDYKGTIKYKGVTYKVVAGQLYKQK